MSLEAGFVTVEDFNEDDDFINLSALLTDGGPTDYRDLLEITESRGDTFLTAGDAVMMLENTRIRDLSDANFTYDSPDFITTGGARDISEGYIADTGFLHTLTLTADAFAPAFDLLWAAELGLEAEIDLPDALPEPSVEMSVPVEKPEIIGPDFDNPLVAIIRENALVVETLDYGYDLDSIFQAFINPALAALPAIRAITFGLDTADRFVGNYWGEKYFGKDGDDIIQGGGMSSSSARAMARHGLRISRSGLMCWILRISKSRPIRPMTG